jgi:hypothetical protein
MAPRTFAMQALTQKPKNLLTVAIVAALSVNAPRLRGWEKKENTTEPTKEDLPQLQITVDAPSHWRPFLSDDLAEAFGSRLPEVFRRHGYAGEVNFIDREAPRSAVPILAVRLINWRVDRNENAVCTFAAALTCGDRQHELGLFENTAHGWNNHTAERWGFADALGDVADGALCDLATKLDETGLLPGFQLARDR